LAASPIAIPTIPAPAINGTIFTPITSRVIIMPVLKIIIPENFLNRSRITSSKADFVLLASFSCRNGMSKEIILLANTHRSRIIEA